MQIKSLKWVENEHQGVLECVSELYRAQILTGPAGPTELLIFGTFWGYYLDPDAAKLAAQIEFDRRISEVIIGSV